MTIESQIVHCREILAGHGYTVFSGELGLNKWWYLVKELGITGVESSDFIMVAGVRCGIHPLLQPGITVTGFTGY